MSVGRGEGRTKVKGIDCRSALRLCHSLEAYCLGYHIGVPGGKVTPSFRVYGLEVISEVALGEA